MTSAIVTITTGKGGVGKTTLLSVLIAEALRRIPDDARILVIDGDPDQSLALTLGVPEPGATLADIRDEKFNARTLREAGKPIAEYARGLLAERRVLYPVTVEGRTVDFLAMGRSKETGCYCAINNALAQVFDEIQEAYDYIFVDSPAGTEHLNRYRIKKVSYFIVIQGTSYASRKVKSRILETVERVGMDVQHVIDVVSHTRDTGAPSLLNGAIQVAFDEDLADFAMNGRPLAELPETSVARTALRPLAAKIV